jgi:DNA-3-methyladenine glycosylase II
VDHRIHTDAELEAALASLVAIDPRFARALASAGPPAVRRRDPGFAGLASIVISQQLSTASAKAIWDRFAAAVEPLDHRTLLRARSSRLTRAGLSAAKIKTLKAVAKAIERGDLEVGILGQISADEAHRMLTAVHGIGPWTADIYLLFCLGHADAWPAGDLALQEATRMLLALQARPTAKEMLALAERWRPWRGAAALLLWSYYRARKQRDGAPVAPQRRGNRG